MDSKQFHQFLHDHNNILLLASSARKFDTLPAALAISYILTDLNKNTTIYFPGPLPAQLNFLNLSIRISSSIGKQNSCTIVINTDKTPLASIHRERTGPLLKITFRGSENTVFTKDCINFEGEFSDWDAIIAVGFEGTKELTREIQRSSVSLEKVPLLMIHNKEMREADGVAAICDTNSTCCCEVLIKTIKEGHEELITEEVATALLAGLISSTNNFQNAGVKPQSLFAAAYLIAKNAKKEAIIRHLYKTKPLEFIKLWGYALAKFSYDEDKKIGWSTVLRDDFINSGATHSQVPMLVSELRNNFAQAELFIVGIETRGGERLALIHAVDSKVASRLAQSIQYPFKNSSVLVPLPKTGSVPHATNLLVKRAKMLL